jgi:hypothetical protein
MNINKNLSEKPMVTPSGRAQWVKVNSRYDEYEGKRKYKITLTFDKDNEAKMKKICDDLLAAAKEAVEFQGKKWSADATCGYKDDGEHLLFTFQTTAFYNDKNTGEEIQKIIPILDCKTHKVIGKDTAIGDGSKVRVSFSPGAYWSSAKSNGINLYLNKLAVDELVVYSGSNNFDEFGESVATDADDFADMEDNEDIPV